MHLCDFYLSWYQPPNLPVALCCLQPRDVNLYQFYRVYRYVFLNSGYVYGRFFHSVLSVYERTTLVFVIIYISVNSLVIYWNDPYNLVILEQSRKKVILLTKDINSFRSVLESRYSDTREEFFLQKWKDKMIKTLCLEV